MEALDVILSCDFSFGLLMFDYAAGRRPLQEASSQHATQACSTLPARALASSGPGRAAVGLRLQQVRYGHPSVPPQSRSRPWVLHTNTWLIPQPPLLFCGYLEGQVSAARGVLSSGRPLFSMRIKARSPGLVIRPLS